MDLKFLEDKFSPEQIEEIKFGIIDGVNVAYYAKPEYSAQDMRIMRNGTIISRKENEGKKSELDNLAKYKDETYYKRIVEYYKSLYNITIGNLINDNTIDSNRNRIVNRYVNTIPNEAFKSLCDAENLYHMLNIKTIDPTDTYLLHLAAKAYTLVLEQMFLSILKDNYSPTNVSIDTILEITSNVIRKSEKNAFTDFYNNFYDDIWEIKYRNRKWFGDKISIEDVDYIRNFLFEFYPTDNGYKCNMDILAELVKNNPIENINL